MYAHSLSQKIFQKSQFEILTFSQMTFREISSLNRTTPLSLAGKELKRFLYFRAILHIHHRKSRIQTDKQTKWIYYWYVEYSLTFHIL